MEASQYSCPPPVANVLPFPVARHRFHLSDSTSISMSESRDRNTKLYTDESENVTNFEELQAFAFPLERKMKKVMDFSCGKENSVPRRSTLEDEIDSENQSLLMRMSEDEICTARVEIMDRINPRLVQFLQKRGKQKLKKQNSLDFDEISTSDHKILSLSSNNQLKGSDGLNQQKGVDTQMLLKTISQDMTTNFSDGFPGGGRKSNDFWSLWSERVEAVRAIRFSLDGTISENDEILSSNGKNKFGSVYSSDKIMERDFLRTEGDPGFVGYTIKEAVSLTRSVIPGQRTLALNLIAAVLDKASHSIIEIPVGQSIRDREVFQISKVVDWEAVWAYALGPEPELALSLRLSLDDNHSSVVLACVKVICSALNTNITEDYFDVSEKVPFYDRDICTAPVFRSKPEVDTGFLRGGFWKHSAKISNIFSLDMNAADDKKSKSRTINDDIIVSGQDFSAGLIRMGIVPRVCFLLEENTSTVLGERLLCVLISLARHSTACAHAIVQYPYLIKTILKRFATETPAEISPYMTKSVYLLKVLARYDKKISMNMVNNGVFGDVTRNLFYPSTSHIKLVQSGENCKFSPLMIEQLRLWKVIVSFGAGVSYFEDFLSTMYPWFLPIELKELFTNKVQPEFFFISSEVYLVLAAMAKGLPDCYSSSATDNDRSWSWGRAWEIVDLALSWVSLSNSFSNDVKLVHHCHHRNMVPMIWVISSINCFLSCVLERVIVSNTEEHSPHIHEYVLKIRLAIAKSYFSYSEPTRFYQNDSFFTDLLCLFRYDRSISELSFASVGCLYGISRVIFFADKVLEDGKLPFPLNEFKPLLDYLMEEVSSKWKVAQSIESFGRGGPSPGVGFGWGAAGGGFWSEFILLAQAEVTLLIKLLLMMVSFMWEDEMFIAKMINSLLSASLILGPRDGDNFGEVLDLLFQVSTMSHVGVYIQKFLNSNGRMKSFHWRYSDDDYRNLCLALAHHFKNRWLLEKKDPHKPGRRNDRKLDAIVEEDGFFKGSSQCNRFIVGWIHGRFPLPINWFLSPITTAENYSIIYGAGGPNFWKVVEGGLFFTLGVEIISLSSTNPASHLSLTWKLHSLSVILLAGMTFLECERSRDVYETLQDLYGQQLSGLADRGEVGEGLRFQKDVDESYPVFVESVVEQFGAVSYGNIFFGRQVAVYLCRCVEPTIRLSTWNALLDTHVLGLLPSLDKCLGNAECYLEPVEDNDAILEAYVRSWVSGELDKACVKRSVAYFIVLHHVSCFIFEFAHLHNKIALRNRMLKSLLRNCFGKQQKKDMMMELIKYCTRKVITVEEEEQILGKRVHILREACESNSTLLAQLQLFDFFSSHSQP